MTKKERLDRFLVAKGLAESREKARALIMAGAVFVDGRRIDKPGSRVLDAVAVTLKGRPYPYVGRGGVKLEAALHHFGVPVEGRTLLDVGASTGGFTDCLLRHGAERVFAVDVGYGQLDWRLRQDPRVTVLERTNIRYLTPLDMAEPLDGAVIDVSFISLRLVVPPVSDLLGPDGFIIALIKPQFEVGRGQVGKGGIVRDPGLHQEVIIALSAFFEAAGWIVGGHIPSPVSRSKGNREFLIYLSRRTRSVG